MSTENLFEPVDEAKRARALKAMHKFASDRGLELVATAAEAGDMMALYQAFMGQLTPLQRELLDVALRFAVDEETRAPTRHRWRQEAWSGGVAHLVCDDCSADDYVEPTDTSHLQRVDCPGGSIE